MGASIVAAGGAGKGDGFRRHSSAFLYVFPVSRLSFGHPFDGCRQAFDASLISSGFGNPLDIVAPVAGAESFERGTGLLVFLERQHEILRHLEFRSSTRRFLWNFHSALVEGDR